MSLGYISSLCFTNISNDYFDDKIVLIDGTNTYFMTVKEKKNTSVKKGTGNPVDIFYFGKGG